MLFCWNCYSFATISLQFCCNCYIFNIFVTFSTFATFSTFSTLVTFLTLVTFSTFSTFVLNREPRLKIPVQQTSVHLQETLASTTSWIDLDFEIFQTCLWSLFNFRLLVAAQKLLRHQWMQQEQQGHCLIVICFLLNIVLGLSFFFGFKHLLSNDSDAFFFATGHPFSRVTLFFMGISGALLLQVTQKSQTDHDADVENSEGPSFSNFCTLATGKISHKFWKMRPFFRLKKRQWV